MLKRLATFFGAISPTAYLVCATIIITTALVCLTFKDYDRYAIHRYGADNSWTCVFDKKTGVRFYQPNEGEMNYRDYPNGIYVHRKQKELKK